MYAAEVASSNSHGSAKSCIQALLKTREQHINPVKTLHNISKEDSSHLYHPSVSSDNSDLGLSAQNLELKFKSQTSNDYPSYEASSPDNLDYQKDFNYSQKLFHIADGNLYSIFSPIQGRSYGMKPSFLRKQKYTVQECHSRGRKNLRKGLKFHNFLPSESVTSEKDNGYLRTKWKVHSECRLREEHGTKQITISNWSQSIQNPSDGLSECSKTTFNCDSSLKVSSLAKQSTLAKYENVSKKKDDDVDPYDFNLSLQNNSLENKGAFNSRDTYTNGVKARNSNSGSKIDSLKFVLNSAIENPVVSECQIIDCDETNNQNKSFQSLKHRRKPVQTRRIVPYVKYLSIMEENESLPLDLSSKCLNDNCQSPVSSSGEESLSQNISGKTSMNSDSLDYLKNSDARENNRNNFLGSSSSSSLHTSNTVNSSEMLKTQIATPLTFLCPLTINENIMNIGQVLPQTDKNELQDTSIINREVNNNQNKNKCLSTVAGNSTVINHSLPNNALYTVQKSFVKDTHPKTRRRNQRSVIKQKLEDTFRQNGFLVKTKQVSDGEATFCKFRQLRKYTRYYLKSWQQHLPDEVHKMWKGFLPPKTVLPPVSGNSESSNGTTS
ncbi:serine/threonine-protein kinase DDB_G0283821-like [Stegodyphus dumicola]|uniref:serine/threonine-protein kinase DDB_G0283821-like n=1 Tax=Stegodyphus dumicola TaxID=202533 RepID=UPI0015ADC6A0|nr:serine/threonine-protein kinase DDB_G0283821-like [Stegodyphus dumicola]